MSELAKYNGKAVKIGTCEMMYYLRYEDRHKVTAMSGNVDPSNCPGLFFRLPFPDEDGIRPGYYDSHDPFVKYENGSYYTNHYCMLDNLHPSLTEGPIDPGLVQTTVPQLGLLVNLKCYHGLKLNASSNDAQFHWNGKRNPLVLSYLKDTGTELRVCVNCIGCGHMWSFSWDEIEGAILNPEMKERIRKLCSEYKARLEAKALTAETI